MPMHRIYHTPGSIAPEDKKAIATGITEFYTKYVHLPAFYVVVLFIEVDKQSYFVGGKPNDKFVRIAISHVARSFEGYRKAEEYFDIYEQILAPYIKAKGFDWEVQVEEGERDFLRVNGMVIPDSGSEQEKEWVRLNKAVPY